MYFEVFYVLKSLMLYHNIYFQSLDQHTMLGIWEIIFWLSFFQEAPLKHSMVPTTSWYDSLFVTGKSHIGNMGRMTYILPELCPWNKYNGKIALDYPFRNMKCSVWIEEFEVLQGGNSDSLELNNFITNSTNKCIMSVAYFYSINSIKQMS